MAVRLFAQIEKAVGTKLPLSILFQAPTIEQLALAIAGKGWSSPGASLVEIQAGGTKPPIFWLHTLGGGGGGGLFTYQKLAQLLGPDQPSYGLVTPPEPFTKIETMAAHYIQEMRTLQPVGPYYIGGFCFGGVIAYEIARQLREQGATVGMLVLLESLPPRSEKIRKFTPEFITHLTGNLPLWLMYLLGNPAEIREALSAKTIVARRKMDRLFHHAKTATGASSRLGEVLDMTHYPPDFRRYAEIHWNALINYFPQSYPGRVTLFRTKKPRLFNYNPEKIWAKLALGGVDVRLVSGTHDKILHDPFVEEIAKHLKAALNEAQQKNQSAAGRP